MQLFMLLISPSLLNTMMHAADQPLPLADGSADPQADMAQAVSAKQTSCRTGARKVPSPGAIPNTPLLAVHSTPCTVQV